ncbi:uncharacterized protein LOC18432729 isoform X1 [Amborella trichopoda]|uniref:uncharacterized protein LOC18432729 isoform X1 n=1 Tax=Amborella trichopoda TaxID=13333 RepID=UPI0005D40EFE|nr:uncharacterized protein LOC18432729 isoform X1 [Amborella trichopoda]|eukprot:XP_011622834.1 uncharacterized protein LOC18432729 isoform X1 [Amborella trichopoda]
MVGVDITQPQRVVFLIDLQPLHQCPNPHLYISLIKASIQKCLANPSLSSSLSAFKLFYSSLSPLLSSSHIHQLLSKSLLLSHFDFPPKTQSTLFRTLESLKIPCHRQQSGSSPFATAELLARALQQIVHDYWWDAQDNGTQLSNHLHVSLNPNKHFLIVLFSPILWSHEMLSKFMGMEIKDGFVDRCCFSKSFCQVFGSVREAFESRGIHLCWVDVSGAEERFGNQLGLLDEEIKGFGWGVNSTDVILCGSQIVPFGLIWPTIAFSMEIVGQNKGSAELTLEISDVNGMPLSCRYCDLELINMEPCLNRTDPLGIKRCLVSSDRKQSLKKLDTDSVKIHVHRVFSKDLSVNVERVVLAVFLLRGFAGKSRERNNVEACDPCGFVADRVLEKLRSKESEFMAGKPAWQLFLAFLTRKYYQALVSVTDKNGCSHMGVLDPFTAHSAILSIIDAGSNHLQENAYLECGMSANSNQQNLVTDCQFEASIYVPLCTAEDVAERRDRRHAERGERKLKLSSTLTNLTWDSFYKSVLKHFCGEQPETDTPLSLKDFYMMNGCKLSKKLRFLNCWTKQIEKSSVFCESASIMDLRNSQKDDVDEDKEVTVMSTQSLPSSESVADCTSLSQCQDDGSDILNSEDPETFFKSVSEKMAQGISDPEVDLGFLAGCLVELSINWLLAKHEGQLPSKKFGEAFNANSASHLGQLLLRTPEELEVKYKNCPSSSSAAYSNTSAHYTLENKVQEHELQVLIRMEILRSKICGDIEANEKDEMVKDICCLLENIQFNLQGEIFVGEDLVQFAERVIKSRYADSLQDLVHEIYNQMEFSAVDALDSPIIIEQAQNLSEPCLFGNDHHQHRGDAANDEVEAEEHRLKEEARERREKARRLAQLTSWAPNLGRVWAPRRTQIPAKIPRRMGSCQRKGHGEVAEVVYETPMAETKKRCRTDCGGGSVSKALFSDPLN